MYVEISDNRLVSCVLWQKTSVTLDETWALDLSPTFSPDVPRLCNGERTVAVLALTPRFETFGWGTETGQFIDEIRSHTGQQSM